LEENKIYSKYEMNVETFVKMIKSKRKQHIERKSYFKEKHVTYSKKNKEGETKEKLQ
jgi:hypothetical protein